MTTALGVSQNFQGSYFWEYLSHLETGRELNVHKTFSTAQKMKFSIKDFFSKCDHFLQYKKISGHPFNKH